MTLARTLLMSATVLVLSTACQSSSGTERQAELTSMQIMDMPATWQAAMTEAGEAPVGWIALMSDPVLTDLVIEAQTNNPGLLLTQARLDEAAALVRQARGSRFPQLGMSTNFDRSGRQDSAPQASLGIGLEASWDADLWGRLASQQSAAETSRAAIEADLKGAQNLISAQVASTYLLVIELGQQEAIIDEVVTSLTEIKRIVEVREESGLAARQDVALAKADLANAREILKQTQGSRRAAIRALETLLGRYPAAQAKIGLVLPDEPDAPPAGLPSELLERRPDIVAAERRVAAALNSLDAAKTAKLPSLQLTSSLGGSSNTLGNILSPSNVAWQTAGALIAPLFTAGRLEAQEDAATAQVQQAVQAYAQAAITAFGEVETALDQYKLSKDRLHEAEIAVAGNREAFEIAVARFDVGETDLLDVLTIQQRLLESQSQHVALRRQQLDEFINLSLALGGGWEE